MRYFRLSFTFLGLVAFNFCSHALAQVGAVTSVQVYAETQASPPQITLKWETSPHPVSHIYVYRRLPNSGTNWVYLGNDPAPTATQYTDTSVSVGVRYEYRVYRVYSSGSTVHARGYTIAGIDAPLLDQRGTVILVVDSTQQEALTTEIERFQSDLIGDGWQVLMETAAPSDTPDSVRAKLQIHYNADPSNIKGAILLGRIPVPYSGDIQPDGHSDHGGAWPADTYYADLTGTWTDETVTRTTATQTRHHNVPGDGKFDQSNLPSDANIAIGRIDMANMSGFGGGANETELLRNYLRKNHEFRHRLGSYADVPRRGLIRDGFGLINSNTEAPAYVAWAGFPPMFGPGNVSASANWFPTLETNKYLWAYGSGPGSYTSAGSIGTSEDFKTKNSLAVFNLLFGSYFGDWDSPTDNFHRAPLAGASGSLGLVSTWATRPDWQIHGMTLGETIGDAYLRTVNNLSDWDPRWWSDYYNRYTVYGRGVHTALMGDPTLRLHPVAAPTNGVYARNGAEVQLSWQAPANEPDLIGYHVYRADSLNGTYTRLTGSVISTTEYTDSSAPLESDSVYQVRTVVLTESASGTYYNAGQASYIQEGDDGADIEASVQLANLVQSYNATVRSVSVSTDPPDLSVSVTYDGSAALPVNAGSYAVVATVTAPGHIGSAKGTLVISEAPITVTAHAKSKFEGQSDPSLTWGITGGELFGMDSLDGSLTRAAGEAPGTYAIQQGTLTAGSNYSLQFVEADLTIMPTLVGDFMLSFAEGSVEETAETIQVTVARESLAGDQVVLLASDDPRVTPPASVVIPDGQYSATFTVAVSGPASETPITLTATAPAARAGESFAYESGTALPGKTGGWGFGTDWLGDAFSPTIGSAVTYSKNGDVGSGSTAAARFANGSGTNGSGGSSAYRNLATPVSTGQVWISWLHDRVSSNWSTGFNIRSAAGGSWLTVDYNGGNNNNWGLTQHQGVRTSILSGDPRPAVYFFVVQLDFESDLIRVWMNPEVSGSAPLLADGYAEVAMTDASNRSLGRILLSGWSNQNQTEFDQIDEIRVATSFAGLYAAQSASDSLLITSDVDVERVVLMDAAFPNATGGNITVPTSDAAWKVHFSGTGAEVLSTGHSAGAPTAGVNNTQSHPDAWDGGTQGVAYMYHGTWPSTTAFLLWRELPTAVPQDAALRFGWYNLHQHVDSQTRLAIQVNGQWYLSTTPFTSAQTGATADFSARAEAALLDFSAAASSWSAFSFTPGSTFDVIGNPAPLESDLPAGDITAVGLYTYTVAGATAAGVSLDSFQLLGPEAEVLPDPETAMVFFESEAELTQHFCVNHGTASVQATGGIDNSGALITTGNPQMLLRSRVFDAADANALGVHVKIGEQANSGYDSVTAMLGFVTTPTMNFQGTASDPNVYVAARVLNLSSNGGYRLEILNKTATNSAQSTVAGGDTFSLINGSWIYVRLRVSPGASELTLDVHESNASGEIGTLLQTLSSPVTNAAVSTDARLWAVLRARRDGNAALMDTFAATAGSAAPSPMRTFVMAGQSNAVGYRSNDRNALPEVIRNGVPGVRGAWFLGNKNGDTLVPHTSDGWGNLNVQTASGPFWPNAEGFGPEITLSRQFQLHYGTDIAMIKFAVNGASLFQNFDPANTGTSGYYDDMCDYLRARRTDLENLEDRESAMEALFWLQGESDASNNSPQPASGDAYAANIIDFVSQIRSDLATPDMSFVASQINPQTSSFPEDLVAKVNNALAAASVADPLFRLSPAIDLHPASSDDLHFDSPQTMEIGERLAIAYLVGHADSTGSGVDDAWELNAFGNLDGSPWEIGGVFYSRRTLYIWNLMDPAGQVFEMDGFRFGTVPDRNYQVEHRESLTEGDWAPFGTLVEGDGEELQILNPLPGFYRVRMLLP